MYTVTQHMQEVYNFKDSYVQDPRTTARCELELANSDATRIRRMEFKINETAFGEALHASPCANIKKIARVLNIRQNIKKLTKDDAVALIVHTVRQKPYYEVKLFAKPTDKAPWGIDIMYDVSLAQNTTCPGGWIKAAKNDIGSKMVCYLLERFDFMKANRAFPTCGKIKLGLKELDSRAPEYGVNGTSDCPNDYTQLEPNGCCIKIEDLINVNEDQIAAYIRNESFNVLTPVQKEQYLAEIRGDMSELHDSLADMNSGDERFRAFGKTLLNSFQRGMVNKLSSRFQYIFDSGEDLDEDVLCKDEAWIPDIVKSFFSGKVLSAVGYSLKAILLAMWYVVRNLMQWSWKAVEFVVGGVKTVLLSAADKLAAWIVMSPKTARIFLAVLKQYKAEMCRSIGDFFVSLGETTGLLERITPPPSPGVALEMAKENTVSQEKQRFLEMVRDGRIVLWNSSEDELVQQLAKLGFKPYHASYRHLLDVTVGELNRNFYRVLSRENAKSEEAVQALEKELKVGAPPTAVAAIDEVRDVQVQVVNPAVTVTGTAYEDDTGAYNAYWKAASGWVNKATDVTAQWISETADVVNAKVELAKQFTSDSGLNARVAEKVVNQITEKGALHTIGKTVGKVVESVPIIGGVFGALSEIAGDAFAEVIKETTETVFYANDLTATVQMLFEVLNVGECMKYIPKVRAKYPFIMQWIEFIEIQLAKRKKDIDALRAVISKQREFSEETSNVRKKLADINNTPDTTLDTVPEGPTVKPANLGGRRRFRRRIRAYSKYLP